jgi:hypothetical protein
MSRHDAGFIYPPLINFLNGSYASNLDNFFLDWNLNQKKIAVIFNCPISGILDGVECLLDGTFNISTSVKFSFQDLDSNGLPDGTPDEYRAGIILESVGSTWVPSGIMSSDGTDNGTKRTVTRGQRLACVIEFDSGFADDYVGLGSLVVAESEFRHATLAIHNGTSWVFDNLFSLGKAIIQMGLKYYPVGQETHNDTNDGTSYTWFNMPEMIPARNIAYVSFNNASSPSQRGIQVVMDEDTMLSGVICNLFLVDAVDTEVDLVIRNPQIEIVRTVSKKILTGESPGNGMRNVLFMLDQELQLNAHEVYRIFVKPTTTTNIALGYLYFDDSLKGIQLTGWHDYVNNEYTFSDDYSDGTTVQDNSTHPSEIPLISLLVRGFATYEDGDNHTWGGYL